MTTLTDGVLSSLSDKAQRICARARKNANIMANEIVNKATRKIVFKQYKF